MEKHRIFLAFGSNLGDKQKNIKDAYNKIEEQIGNIVAQSAFYISKPVGFDSENLFVNSVCEVYSNIDIYSIFSTTQSIEKELGRVEKSNNLNYADRIIDIDLILADDMVINTPVLTIPHPRFHLRDFVLSPLCEIAPDVIHPIFNKSMLQLKNELANK